MTQLHIDEMPASLEAERSVLGSVLLDNELWAQADKLSATDFSLDAHRRIYAGMAQMFTERRAVDLVSLLEHMQYQKTLALIGGASYLASLTEGIPRRPSIAEYVTIVQEKAAMRALVEACATAMNEALSAAGRGGVGRSYELAERLAASIADVTARSNGIWGRHSARRVLTGGFDFFRDVAAGVDWAVEGLIQRGGNGLIVGDPGTAKSMLALDLALHLVAGVTWLGRRIPQPMRVGVISREDHPSLTQQRGKHLYMGAPLELAEALEGIELNHWLYFNTSAQSDTFSLEREADVTEIIGAFQEHKVEFAIFDVFRRLWEGDENDNQAVAKVLAVLTRIQRECGCSVALIHHVGKGGPGKGTIFQRVRGASAIYGWREWAFGIVVENPGDLPRDRIRKIEFETKADQPHEPLYFVIDGLPGQTWLAQCDAPERKTRARKTAQQIEEPKLYGNSGWQDRG